MPENYGQGAAYNGYGQQQVFQGYGQDPNNIANGFGAYPNPLPSQYPGAIDPQSQNVSNPYPYDEDQDLKKGKKQEGEVKVY